MKSEKFLFLLLTAIGLVWSDSHLALAAAQTTCPILGNPVNKKIHIDYQGRRIYFCCPPCVDIFKKDPEAYMQKLRQSGQEPEATPGS